MTEGRRFKMSADGRHLGPSHEKCLGQRRQAVFLCMTAEGVFIEAPRGSEDGKNTTVFMSSAVTLFEI